MNGWAIVSSSAVRHRQLGNKGDNEGHIRQWSRYWCSYKLGYSVGWLSRLQFEEVWVQSLSVLNLSVTDSDIQEDHVMLTVRGLQSVTSLLLMTLWRPEPGNPLIGSLLHTCRHRNIPFLDTK